MEERIKQQNEKACVSVERIESTLLSSFVKKGKETSNKRNYKRNKRKAEEEICSKPTKKRQARGFVHCKEEEKVKKTRKRKSKRQQKDNKIEVDEALRLQRRTRYLLIKMKMQQNLIDAYATEGWKGQSREKIRPYKELERARQQILNCKLGLREAIRQLDLLSSVGSIEEQVMAPDGSIHHDHIFCATCNSREAFVDNDIILCDGTCNRAFHQMCLDPPLETESIPPGDQGWFCKFCDCKIEILDSMNAQIGTNFPVDSNWQDIFNEEASLPIGSEAALNNEVDWPSEDSEDGDYDPETKENSVGSSRRSISDGGGDNDGESDSSSVSLASDGEALSTGSWEGDSNMMELCETSNEEAVSGPRQRRTVDYTKLYHEMFGKDAGLQEPGSEDEDWGPCERRKRRKESDAASSLVTMCESSKKDQHVVEIAEQKERDSVSVEGKGGRRPMFRLPRGAVEKLRQVFAENELPSKAVRDSLSKELSLDPEKVSKWFKNARYMALRNRRTESVKQAEDSKAFSADCGPEAVIEKNIETNEIQDTKDETVMEENTETIQIQETVEETIMEKNTEADEIQDTMDETLMEKNTETNEIQETVPPGFNDSGVYKTTISPCNENQEEIQQANVSFPTTIEDESQQYVEQKDSSLEPHEEPDEEVSSEMSLKTPLEDETETESKMTEEEEFEAVMEMLCRAENKVLDVTQRLERFKTPKGRKKLGKSSSSLPEEDSVVYVPIAEIKEKR
uniref:Pathogenesis-related homeodomain protein n=1 Tax=Noccaea caerulescens TaxID=107243 RepID=A0A1J3E3Z9_NOCCA